MIYNESVYNNKWETKRLSDLGVFSRGKSKHRPRNDPRLFEGGGYPLVQTGEIKEANLYIMSHTQEYGEFGLEQSKLWEKNTLCITIAANIACQNPISGRYQRKQKVRKRRVYGLFFGRGRRIRTLGTRFWRYLPVLHFNRT